MDNDFYYKTAQDRANVELVKEWAAGHGLTLMRASVNSQPWHKVILVGDYDLYPQRIDVYPHKQKAVWNGCVVVGVKNFDTLLLDVYAAAEGGTNAVTRL